MHDIAKYAKLEEDYDFMNELYIVQDKSAQDIAQLLNITTRIVENKLKEHGLVK